MHNEFTIKNNEQEHRVFIQDGFYASTTPTQKLHTHNYTEVHVIANGGANFNAGENSYLLNSGSMIIVPRGVFHSLDTKDDETLHAAFQIDCVIDEISICDIGTDTVLKFVNEAEKTKLSQDFSRVATYISLLCDYFCNNKKLATRPITDYGFLIHEFFSEHYSEDLHIRDLAAVLNLSERQAERQVIRHTGKSFRNALLSIRLKIAEQLLHSTDMSLKEVSRYVGYKSYAGFWKAMQKQANKDR